MGCQDNDLQGIVAGAFENQGIANRGIVIADSCIIEINNRFFLIVLINFDRSEVVVVIRISRNQATSLTRSGVRRCQVFDALPINIPGRPVQLLAVFVVHDQAFLVFEAEGVRERLIVVRVPITCIIRSDL